MSIFLEIWGLGSGGALGVGRMWFWNGGWNFRGGEGSRNLSISLFPPFPIFPHLGDFPHTPPSYSSTRIIFREKGKGSHVDERVEFFLRKWVCRGGKKEEME